MQSNGTETTPQAPAVLLQEEEHKVVMEQHEHPAKPPHSRTVLVPLDASEVSSKTLDWIVDSLINPATDLIVLFSCYRSAARDLPIGMGFDSQGLFSSASLEISNYDELMTDHHNSRMTGAINKLNQQYAHACETRLVEACRSLNEKGVRAKAIIAMGDPRTLIDQQIIKCKADLVVMGRSKRGKIARALMGSVCSHVLNSSPIPVILLP